MINLITMLKLITVVIFLSFGAGLIMHHGEDVAASLNTSADLFKQLQKR